MPPPDFPHSLSWLSGCARALQEEPPSACRFVHAALPAHVPSPKATGAVSASSLSLPQPPEEITGGRLLWPVQTLILYLIVTSLRGTFMTQILPIDDVHVLHVPSWQSYLIGIPEPRATSRSFCPGTHCAVFFAPVLGLRNAGEDT